MSLSPRFQPESPLYPARATPDCRLELPGAAEEARDQRQVDLAPDLGGEWLSG